MKSIISIFLVALLAFTTSCEEEKGSNLPSANGNIDEVIVVISERHKKDTVGRTVSSILRRDFGYLPQPAPTFDLVSLSPDKFGQTFKKHFNVLFIGHLEETGTNLDYFKRFFGRDRIDEIKAEGKTVYTKAPDVWSKGQHVHCILAPTLEALNRDLPERLEAFVQNVQVSEFKRIQNFVYMGYGKNDEINAKIKKQLNIKVDIPGDFKLHPSSKDGFFFLRKSTVDLTNSIFIYALPYTDSSMVDFSYPLQVRNHLGKKYESSQIEGSYMEIDTVYSDVGQREVDFNGHYAIESRGLWGLVNDFMGGAFINYWIFDEKNNRMIMLDGYFYAPDHMYKRRLIREFQAIFSTFQVMEKAE